MSIDPNKFRAASEAAEEWVRVVNHVGRLGQAGRVDKAYTWLMPDVPWVVRDKLELMLDATAMQGNLLDGYTLHAEALDSMNDRLTVASDGPIEWEHGRGYSAVVNNPASVTPHIWSSGHELALGLVRLALELLVYPLEGFAGKELHARARCLLTGRWQAFSITPQEIARYRNRIQRERAKVLTAAPERKVVQLNPTDIRICDLLRKEYPLQGKVIAKRVGATDDYARRRLGRLVKESVLHNDGEGYSLKV